MTIEIEQLPAELQLDQVGEHLYQAAPQIAEGTPARNVVFGGEILAQMILACHLDRAAAANHEKEVKAIHAIFARPGDYSQPITYQVERLHDGRTLGSDTVVFSQGGKVMSQATLLWSADEPDLISHTALSMPVVTGPEDPAHFKEWRVFPGAEGRVVGGVDVTQDYDPPLPPALNVWTKYEQNFSMPVNQAILAWATDGWLIGTAMLPHAGVNESIAHRSISTGVVSHSLSFHDGFRSDEWLLLAHEGIWAGRGRTHGRCTIWTEDGRLVASYTQDNLVRSFGPGGLASDASRVM